ncbi:hypothetical protein KKG05_10245, partial [bacterium]|nr:hypothetical protein [bacterium]
DFGASEGILVVHNSQGNTRVENLWQGKFTGIIIADRISQIENQIIGGIFQLSQSASKWEGDGTIRFSREAIAQALGMVQQEGLEEPLVVTWYE